MPQPAHPYACMHTQTDDQVKNIRPPPPILWADNTHPFNGPLSFVCCPGLPGWAGTRKVKPIWILLKQETVSGNGISWAICKSAPRCRQITTPAPNHSVFYRPDALPATQPTVTKHRLQIKCKLYHQNMKIWAKERQRASYRSSVKSTTSALLFELSDCSPILILKITHVQGLDGIRRNARHLWKICNITLVN